MSDFTGFARLICPIACSNLVEITYKTAIYDISSHTVTLPNGQQLEAHSGLGSDCDNPDGIADKDRGSTPPGLYQLTPREGLFHGVEALRLEPCDGHEMHGRDGILTHSYMLRGRPGQSNGCVVFKDYPAFLAAFKQGMFDKILVITG